MNDPLSSWGDMLLLGSRVREALRHEDVDLTLEVGREITQRFEDHREHSPRFVLGIFLLLLLERVRDTPLEAEWESVVTSFRLQCSQEVEERLPAPEILLGLQQGPKPMFIEAGRLARYYTRRFQETQDPEAFFSSLFATAMALVLGEDALRTDPEVHAEIIRVDDLVDGIWRSA